MFKTALIIISVLTLYSSISAFDDWVEPNAWERHSPSKLRDSCPVCECGAPNTSADEEPSLKMYKNVIDKLFNKHFFMKNTQTGKFERQFRLSLTPTQFKALENTSDMPNINTIVMIVLQRAEDIEKLSDDTAKGFDFWSVWVGFVWICTFSKTCVLALLQICFDPKMRFLMFIFGVLMLIMFIYKRFKKNLIISIVLTFILIGYFITYIDCNKKLELEELNRLNNLNEPITNFFSNFLNRFFEPSAKDKKIQQMKEDMKLKLPFCRPDTVLIMYFNGIFFNQLKAVIEELADAMNVIRNNVPFPFNYIGMVAMPFLFWGLISLMFHYIFNPAQWGRFYQGIRSEQHERQQNVNNHAHEQDRLSGENLKKFFQLLQNNVSNGAKNNIHSSVEDVKDLPRITPKLNESSDGETKKLNQSLNDEEEETKKLNISLNDEVDNIKKDADVEIKSLNDSEECHVEQTLRNRNTCEKAKMT